MRLTENILYILFFWYTPCVLVDFWASTNPNKYWVDLLVSLVGAAGQCFIGAIIIWDNVAEGSQKRRIAAIFLPSLFLTIGLLFIFSSWAREVFFFNSLIAGCFIYSALIFDYYGKDGFEFRTFVIFMSYCLVLTMNDWMLTVDAFKSGAIWFTLLRNLLLYLAIVIYAIIVNFLRHCANLLKLDVGALIRWEKNTVQFLAWHIISVLFITVYAPTTTRFIPE